MTDNPPFECGPECPAPAHHASQGQTSASVHVEAAGNEPEQMDAQHQDAVAENAARADNTRADAAWKACREIWGPAPWSNPDWPGFTHAEYAGYEAWWPAHEQAIQGSWDNSARHPQATEPEAGL